MHTVVRKWGNSLALRLPQRIAGELNIAEGAEVSVTVKDGTLIVTPARPHYTLAELLAGVSPDTQQRETDWGPALGREAW